MKVKTENAEKKAAEKRVVKKGKTLRGRIVELIAAGKENEEIAKVVRKEGFDLPDAKKHYISWYRWSLNRDAAAKKAAKKAPRAKNVKAVKAAKKDAIAEEAAAAD